MKWQLCDFKIRPWLEWGVSLSRAGVMSCECDEGRCAWWLNRCRWRRSVMEDTGHSLTVPPPPGRRVPRRNNKTWEGGWAPWMSEEDMDKGKASMADPGLREAMADPGLREAMADPGLREAVADPGLREAMADLEAWETMAYFLCAAMVGHRSPWPWLWARPPRQRIYSPPPKFSWGSSPLVGTQEGGH